jgi:hypothetical protein
MSRYDLCLEFNSASYGVACTRTTSRRILFKLLTYCFHKIHMNTHSGVVFYPTFID